MNARAAVAQALSEALPTYRVINHSRTIDRVDQRTILVWQDGLTPHPPAGRDGIQVRLTVLVLTPHADVERADDDLEAALLDVLAVLHPLDSVLWTDAERGVFGDDTWNGYKITLTAGAVVNVTEETP